MSEIRKLPASAGAEWLLTGFSLLRRAPLALGMLGMTWGLIALLAYGLSMMVPTLGLAVQFLMLLAGPVFMGGMLWAVREVDEGRPARPSHLLHGLHDGRAPHLLVSLLPQALAVVVLAALLLLMIGYGGLQHLSHVMAQINEINQSGAQPDQAQVQALVAELPAGRILLWLLLVVVTFAALSLALFVMPPQVMFDHATGVHALRESLRAGMRNLPALLVFFVLTFIALVAIYFAVALVAMIASLLIGTAAMLLAQLLLMAVLMPVFAGAVYAAWKQMFAPLGATPPPIGGGRSDVFVA
ncbi:MAG TPA: BPSS1780 family membrane protein [Stenotrophomonas sp.]|nr:BPSS1780 family membrane protein [Stenotrophomonas sp.]